jgi:hypothetical protein
MKKSLFILSSLLTIGLINEFNSQTWNLLIPPTAYDTVQLRFAQTAFNQNSGKFYSLFKSGAVCKVQEFDLVTNTTTVINTNNLPSEDLGPFTLDPTNNKLIAARSGRENLYSVSLNGGAWLQTGSGSFDSDSYGAPYYWNSFNNSVAFMGGYGSYSVKNWIWENNNGSWNNVYVNNAICDNSNPAKRNTQLALGSPSSNEIYIFSGMGSCNGDQFSSSCSLGSPIATDVGYFCWLKDLWKLDLTTNQFTNILPVNSSSITKEGVIVFDYVNNIFYIVGGYEYSATYNPNAGNVIDFETGILRYRVGIDSGFSPITIGGTPPPTTNLNSIGTNAAYYDAINNQIVWAREDGIWGISFSSDIKEAESSGSILVYPNPTNSSLYIDINEGLIGSFFQLTDNIGKVIIEGKLENQTSIVELGKLVEGNYFITIGDKEKQVFKIVKN